MARRAAVTAASVVAALVLLGACGSSGSKTTGTTTAASSGGSGGAGSSGGGSGSSGGGGSSSNESVSNQIKSLTQSINGGRNNAYKAVYTSTAQGSSGPITIEQKPPKSVFMTSAGSVINNGTTTYFCTTGTKTCITAGAGNPLSGITQAFSPDTVIGALQAAAAQADAHAAGANATFSTQSVAGQASDCITVTGNGQTGKYCVTHNGILALVETSSGSFQLTSYSSSVSDSDFDLPAGSTVQSIP